MKKRILLLAALLFLTSCAGKGKPALTRAAELAPAALPALSHTGKSEDYAGPYSTCYLNEDGTKTVYLYAAPVERQTARKEGGSLVFQSGAASLRTELPARVEEAAPITLSSGTDLAGVFFQSPVQGTEQEHQTAFHETRQGMVYENAISDGISLACFPTSFGINMELTLDKKPGAGELRLKLKAPGYLPDISSPDYIRLQKPEQVPESDKGLLLTAPLAVDKKGSWKFPGTVKLADKELKTGTFTVEYGLDEGYWEQADYPVTLSQSVCLGAPKQVDTSAYEKTPQRAGHYLSPYLVLGDQTEKGAGRACIRFPYLEYMGLDPDKVVSAEYIVRNLFDLKKPAEVALYGVTENWCSVNTRWGSLPKTDKEPAARVMIKKAGEYSLPMTELLREILRTDENAAHNIRSGWMLACEGEGNSLLLPSGDNGISSPCLKITVKA